MIDSWNKDPRTNLALLCLLVWLAAGVAGPVAQESDLPEETLPRAQALIRDRNTTVGTTPHFKVYSDDPRIDTKKCAELLESLQRQIDTDWGAFPGRKKDVPAAHVFLFYSRLKYAQLMGASVREIGIFGLGHYNPRADIVAIHTDTVPPGDLPDVLVHEATHQLTQMTLLGQGVLSSHWLMEGMAEYYGNMRRDPKAGFQPGRMGDKGIELFHQGSNKVYGLREDELRQYKKELSKGVAAPLDTLLGMEPEQFLSDGVMMRYTASWLLVHFLMQGDGGRHREGLGRYIEKEAAGERGPAVLYEALGLDATTLQTAFEAHVKKM